MKNRELVNRIKEESVYLLAAFIAAIIIFKIAFYKEGIATVIKTVIGIFWIFILPGFYLLYYWYEKIGFIERFIIGIVTSAVIIGISSYYIGVIGIHIKYHIILLPLIFLAVDFMIVLKIKKG